MDNRYHKKTLFVGNGINQLHNTINWTKLLQDIVKETGKDKNISFQHKPYPLLYEEIYTRAKRFKSFEEKEIRKIIASKTEDIKANDYHKKLMQLPFENILTTNYDYCLEDSTERVFVKENEKERKYSLFRKKISKEKTVWHIHEEIEQTESILIGYEHYMGAIQKMRNYLTGHIEIRRKNNAGQSEIHKWKSPYKNGCHNFENYRYHSWIDIFLRDEIHIVGFGLKFDEVDLWWLLSYRNRLLLEDKLKCGKIHYYYFDKGDNKEEENAKIDMLSILGVKNIKIDLDRLNGEWDYKKGWDKLLSKLKEIHLNSIG